MIRTIQISAQLHDVGKIGVDDKVLKKPGFLTPEEFEVMKQHPVKGANIMKSIEQMREMVPGMKYHHEQWDGKGYPFKLAGEQIPLIARILAVADAYDAMCSDRPYRRGMPVERVEELFQQGAAQQWDAEVIKAYFTSKSDVLKISQEERANLTLDVQQWT